MYSRILAGLCPDEAQQPAFLEALKPAVIKLRRKYNEGPNIAIDYADDSMAEAYAMAYGSPAYELTGELLRCHPPDFLIQPDCETFRLVVFAAGPGLECAAVADYLAEYRPEVNRLEALLVDRVDDAWVPVRRQVYRMIPSRPQVKPCSLTRDITDPAVFDELEEWLWRADLVLFQNCLNELGAGIPLQRLFGMLPARSTVIFGDLRNYDTTLRALFEAVKNALQSKCSLQLNRNHSHWLQYTPTGLVRRHLLTGSHRYLHPRVMLKFARLSVRKL